MPCNDYGAAEQDNTRLHERNDELAKMLCACCQAIENRNQIIPAIAMEWWREHKRLDAIRLVQEAKEAKRREERNAALSKLTPEERRLIGVKFNL